MMVEPNLLNIGEAFLRVVCVMRQISTAAVTRTSVAAAVAGCTR